jgi:hypothetical protein
MIADTAFLSDFHDEQQRRLVGPARHFLATDRNQPLRSICGQDRLHH